MEVELGSNVEVEVVSDEKSRIKIEKLFDFEPRGYYVYVHRKMTNGEIFYVGKGKGIRGWRPYSRNIIWKNKAEKHGVYVEIVMDNLTEELALELEREFIAFYGRISNNDGCLANVMSIGNHDPGVSGISHYCADRRIWHFVNVFTFESYIGYRVDFIKEKGINIKPVILGKYYIVKGWTTMDVFSTTPLWKLRNPRKECKADQTLHRLYNLETKEIKEMRVIDTREIMNSSGHDLISGRVLVSRDWCLEENKHKWYSFSKDYREYLFIHESGQQILATKSKFHKTTGVRPDCLFTTNYIKYVHKGWRVIK